LSDQGRPKPRTAQDAPAIRPAVVDARRARAIPGLSSSELSYGRAMGRMWRGALPIVGLVLSLGAPARAQEIVSAEAPADPPETPPLPPAAPTLPTVAAERYRLENGLEVVLDPTDEDTVAVCVTYHSGASSQQAGWTGLAHLGEHAMFEGSLHAPRHFLDELDALGVLEVNGVTERDRTRYYEVVPREHLERVLFLEADRMAFLLSQLSESRLATQREVVLREREERVDLGGLGLIPGLVASVLYVTPDHPYADLFEHAEDVRAIQLADVQWFLSTHYGPDDATIVVTGGFDRELARASIARWFAPIRRIAAAPSPVTAPEITHVPVERRLVVEAPLRRDQLLVTWPTPAYGSPEHAVLELIAARLDRRLNETLVDEGDATAVDVTQYAYELASELEIDVVTGRGDGTEAALTAIDRELVAMAESLPTPEEIEELVIELTRRDVARIEDGATRAALLGRRARLAPDGHWSLAWDLARWRAVTPEQFREVARTWLPQRRRLVLSLAARRHTPWEGRVVVDISLGPDGQEVAAP
jgi:zinc protease